MLVYGCQELFEARVSTEFENEVNMLSQVEHLNLVKLIGYLEEGDERILVTEFVTNGNLRQHLDGTFFKPGIHTYIQIMTHV
jgi:serine/threonine protein kinase